MFIELWPNGVCPSVYSQDIFQRDMLDHLGSAKCSWKGLAYLGLLSPTCEKVKKKGEMGIDCGEHECYNCIFKIWELIC